MYVSLKVMDGYDIRVFWSAKRAWCGGCMQHRGE